MNNDHKVAELFVRLAGDKLEECMFKAAELTLEGKTSNRAMADALEAFGRTRLPNKEKTKKKAKTDAPA